MADAYNDPYNEAPAGEGNGRGRSQSPGGRPEYEDRRNGGGYDDRREREREPQGGDRGRAEGSEQPNPGNNLHVSGLSNRVEARDLEEKFGAIGKVAKASIMYDPHTRDSRGFGFVMMDNHEDANKCIQELDKTEFMGKIMTVAMARRARARTPTPGRYFGPPKASMGGYGDRAERPYQPRSYDSRYNDRPRYDDRDRYDRGPPPPRYDDRRYDSRGGGGGGGYDDYRSGPPPPRDGPPRGGGGYDDRRPPPPRDDRYESRSRY